MGKKIDWIIHYCANGYCEECGKVEIGFLPFLCNAHTHWNGPVWSYGLSTGIAPAQRRNYVHFKHPWSDGSVRAAIL